VKSELSEHVLIGVVYWPVIYLVCPTANEFI